MRKIYSFRILDFKRARDVRARAQGDREESLPRELPMKARLSRFYPFYPFFLWDIVFPSLFLSSARARATCTNFCADFPLYSFLNKRIQFSAMVKAP